MALSMKRTSGERASGQRRRREDGATTKAQLLEAAGVLFAEKGFDRTTAKEIAEKAGTNAASVNYHFGGIEGLYEEVLVEAHHRFVSLQALASAVEGEGDPQQKLRRLLELFINAVTEPASSSWAVRVLTREILSPTPYFHTLAPESDRAQEIAHFRLGLRSARSPAGASLGSAGLLQHRGTLLPTFSWLIDT